MCNSDANEQFWYCPVFSSTRPSLLGYCLLGKGWMGLTSRHVTRTSRQATAAATTMITRLLKVIRQQATAPYIAPPPHPPPKKLSLPVEIRGLIDSRSYRIYQKAASLITNFLTNFLRYLTLTERYRWLKRLYLTICTVRIKFVIIRIFSVRIINSWS